MAIDRQLGAEMWGVLVLKSKHQSEFYFKI